MLQRHANDASLIDVLDHVLDKGIVIDAWVTLSLVGISLVTLEARIVVASVETYLKRTDAAGRRKPEAGLLAGVWHTS